MMPWASGGRTCATSGPPSVSPAGMVVEVAASGADVEVSGVVVVVTCMIPPGGRVDDVEVAVEEGVAPSGLVVLLLVVDEAGGAVVVLSAGVEDAVVVVL